MNNKEIERFQFITNGADPKVHIEQTEKVCEGGCKWVQLRMKDFDEEIFLDTALKVKGITDKFNSKLIINDNVNIAKEVGASGVHLGKYDMKVNQAREFMGNSFIIGGTANTFSEVAGISAEGADYIGLGPYRHTTTKKKLSQVLGIISYSSILDQLKEAKVFTPIIGIGGITEDDIDCVLQAGLYGVAVSSVITHAENIVLKTKKIIDKIQNHIR